VDGWEKVVAALGTSHPLLAGALDHTSVGAFDDGSLTLDVAGEVTDRRLSPRIADLEQLIARLAPSVTRIVIRRVAAVTDTPHLRRVQRENIAREAMRADILNHPLIIALQRRLGGVVGQVELQVSQIPGDGRKA
jgi:hypothetical protein